MSFSGNKEFDKESVVQASEDKDYLNVLATLRDYLEEKENMYMSAEKMDIEQVEILQNVILDLIGNLDSREKIESIWSGILEEIQVKDDHDVSDISVWLKKIILEMEKYTQNHEFSKIDVINANDDLSTPMVLLDDGDKINQFSGIQDKTTKNIEGEIDGKKMSDLNDKELDTLVATKDANDANGTNGTNDANLSAKIEKKFSIKQEDTEETESSLKTPRKASIEDEVNMKNGVGDSDAKDDSALFYGNTLLDELKEQSDTSMIQKTVPQSRVFRDEIISSIISKAKLLVTNKQSEIVVDLKPESLGKMVLKVVTENDNVTAKFFTENYRVKEVIEANFQALKDSLEKQGLIVQDISVSVGDGRHDNSSFERRDKGKFIGGVKRSKSTGSIAASIYDNGNYRDNGNILENAYKWPNSTINLIA